MRSIFFHSSCIIELENTALLAFSPERYGSNDSKNVSFCQFISLQNIVHVVGQELAV